MNDAERRVYSRGYNAGSRNSWPDYNPPNPPQEQVLALFLAAKDLRDAAFGVVQVIIPDTEPFIELKRQAESVDIAFEKISQWLKQPS